MAFAHLSPAGAFWRNLGLAYILAPPGSPALRGARANAAEEPRPQKAPEGAKDPAPASTHASWGKNAPKTKRQDAPGPQKRQGGKNVFPPMRPFLPREKWPPAWQAQFGRARPGLVGWSYWELARDLAGAGRADEGRDRRRAFLQNIIRDLSFPPGTHAFWPVCMPDGQGNFSANDEAFWSGLNALGCRILILMGEKAASAARLPDDLSPFCQQMWQGQYVCFLPELDELANGRGSYGRLLALLRSIFQHYPQLRANVKCT